MHRRRLVCPVCQGSYSVPATGRAFCPNCGARERHRLVASYLRYDAPFSIVARSILHVAPVLERGVSRMFTNASQHVTWIDIAPKSREERRMDVEQLDFPNASFDLVMCSHVLEHVQRPMQALREFARVSKVAGHLLLMVPIFVPNQPSVLWDGRMNDALAKVRTRGAHIGDFSVFGGDVPQLVSTAGFAAVASYSRKNVTQSHFLLDEQLLYIGTR